MAKSKINETTTGKIVGGTLGAAAGALVPGLDVTGIPEVIGGAIGSSIGDKITGPDQANEEAAEHNLTHAQYKTLAALRKEGWKKEKTEHKEHGHVVHLTKHSDRNTMHKCTVEPDGSVDKSQSEKPTHNENVCVSEFLKSISQKNYAQADKYLGSLINEKLKDLIRKAAK